MQPITRKKQTDNVSDKSGNKKIPRKFFFKYREYKVQNPKNKKINKNGNNAVFETHCGNYRREKEERNGKKRFTQEQKKIFHQSNLSAYIIRQATNINHPALWILGTKLICSRIYNHFYVHVGTIGTRRFPNSCFKTKFGYSFASTGNISLYLAADFTHFEAGAAIYSG
jgi:hypothetical protein